MIIIRNLIDLVFMGSVKFESNNIGLRDFKLTEKRVETKNVRGY